MTEIIRTECICHDPDHIMQFCLEPGDNRHSTLELYISCQLNPRYGFWGRAWNAVLYVLGRQGQFGHWTEGSLDVPSAMAVQKLISRYLGLSPTGDHRAG